MKVLGFRSDPSAPRYALVTKTSEEFLLLNSSTDSRLKFPATIGDEDECGRITWVYNEIARVFDGHPEIAKVVIKINEYTRSDTKAKRRSSHIDAAVMLCCAQRNVPVTIRVYGNLATTSSDTLRHAEARVGRTLKYWDTKMADAVNAAWWGLQHK